MAGTVLSDCSSAQLFYGDALCQTEPWKSMCCGGGGGAAAPLAPTLAQSDMPAAPIVAGGCGTCRRAAAAAGGTIAGVTAALERPGPIGLPWWVWVLLALIVLNLLRS